VNRADLARVVHRTVIMLFELEVDSEQPVETSGPLGIGGEHDQCRDVNHEVKRVSSVDRAAASSPNPRSPGCP
jgi:hypothetical protein